MSVIKMTDLDFKGKRVLICSDLNMPVKDGNEEPLASSYFNHAPRGSIYQAALTKVTGGNLMKVLSWFHNEWGFSNRMLDTTVALFNAK